MFECSFTWRDVTRVDETPLGQPCRCIRTHAHEGPHRCVCTPLDFFRMEHAMEDAR